MFKGNIEWISEDMGTLAHASELKIGAARAISPEHAITRRDAETFFALTKKEPDFSKNAVVVAGEPLAYSTLKGVGHDRQTTEDLLNRLKAKVLPNRVNLVYPRISSSYELNGSRFQIPRITDMQASALAGVQLDAGATMVIPPLPGGLEEKKTFKMIFERTVNEIQTFRDDRGVVGYIPKIENFVLVRDMIELYVKSGIRVFAVDFSGASNAPSLMRAVVRYIRDAMKIKGRASERDEKYYLHIFNAATSKKSVLDVSPVTDLLTHAYGVDSASNVMWGGGKMEVEKFRYINVNDYGAYRVNAMVKHGGLCACPICSGRSISEIVSGSPKNVMDKLKVHKMSVAHEEAQRITEKISAAQEAYSLTPYLLSKPIAEKETKKILKDVKEIMAG